MCVYIYARIYIYIYIERERENMLQFLEESSVLLLTDEGSHRSVSWQETDDRLLVQATTSPCQLLHIWFRDALVLSQFSKTISTQIFKSPTSSGWSLIFHAEEWAWVAPIPTTFRGAVPGSMGCNAHALPLSAYALEVKRILVAQ